MSKDQLAAIDQEIRQRPALAGLDLAGMRKAFGDRMISNEGLPLPRTAEGSLGGVPVLHIGDETSDDVVFHLHGGGYMLGSAAELARLSGAIGARAGARVISVDYRRAPEHPFPAALDDAFAAYQALLDSGVPSARIAFAGESAGGGLVLATMLAAREAGLPLPSSAVVLSAWTDLTLASESLTSRVAVDPFMRKEALVAWAEAYRAGADPANPLLSPVFADLHGLPPLLIQVGSNEVMLDDSVRLAARAAADEVEVRLEVTPGASHVFQSFGERIDEANRALDDLGSFIRAHYPR
ncbi:MAG TPA: alpha/beta hydrolase [Pseudonocardiaceae bacterium]|nr:alpha/beta hydrolase [Pseudonocardiaceae bacterium]